MMNEILYLLLIFLAGLALGILFFGGLWLTVRKAVVSKRPALLVLTSFVVRIALALTGFYFIGTPGWQRLLTILLGFISARFLVIYFTATKRPVVKKEVYPET